MKMCLDFTRFNEDAYFELKEMKESWINSNADAEYVSLEKVLINLLDGAIRLLSYKFDIDDEIQT